MTNNDRANNGLIAVETSTDRLADPEETLETYIGDCLANLMHLCFQRGIDFEQCRIRGREHFHAELSEESALAEIGALG